MASGKVSTVPPKGSEGEHLNREGVHTSPQSLSQCSPFTDGETEAQRDSGPGSGSRSNPKEMPRLILAQSASKVGKDQTERDRKEFS